MPCGLYARLCHEFLVDYSVHVKVTEMLQNYNDDDDDDDDDMSDDTVLFYAHCMFLQLIVTINI